PPAPTLFPYTTLFRSDEHGPGGPEPPDLGRVARRHAVAEDERRPRVGPSRHRAVDLLDADGDAAERQRDVGLGRGLAGRVGVDEDRKSTRLNSSHVAI